MSALNDGAAAIGAAVRVPLAQSRVKRDGLPLEAGDPVFVACATVPYSGLCELPTVGQVDDLPQLRDRLALLTPDGVPARSSPYDEDGDNRPITAAKEMKGTNSSIGSMLLRRADWSAPVDALEGRGECATRP